MNQFPIGEHISQEFNSELGGLRRQLLTMGGLVEQQIIDALRVLREGDSALAEKLDQADQEINQLEIALDEAGSHILVRRQPAASDLRLIFAILKASSELERVGDEASKIGRLFLSLPIQERDPAGFHEVVRLGEAAQNIIHGALDAFARVDANAALTILREDFRIDRDYESFIRQSITYMMEDPRTIRRVFNSLWIGRSMERIGDHAKNICEYVIYLVYGKDVRHARTDEIEKLMHTRPGTSK